MSGATPGDEQVRKAEVVATLCLATDLGMGLPFEHGLHATLIAMRLADRLAVDRETASQTYYASLLMYSGCTADAEVGAQIFGGSRTTHFTPVIYGSPRQIVQGITRALPDPGVPAPVRITQIARRLPQALRHIDPHLNAICEVAQTLATQLGLPAGVHDLFVNLTERWDGKGRLKRAKGDDIPLPLRINHVARDAAVQQLIGGVEYAAQVVGAHAGRGLDPHVARCLTADAADILALDEDESAWDTTLACEPPPHLTMAGRDIDRALAAMGGFADLTSPHFSGHSGGVAELASAAARRCRLDPSAIVSVQRAALIHDLGRVAVSPKIWNKPAPLTADEWEHVRLHPYHTERIVSRSPVFGALAPTAAAHHERLDRSGYHRGSSGADMQVPARLLAAADAYHAMTEPRPHRAPFSPAGAAEELGREASEGRLDGDVVGAVLEAAGQPVPRIERPAGLTDREAEVVGLLARGLQTKQVARTLGIAGKTADRHIQNAYAKIGISSRAAATLFAVSHGLVAWGELPIDR